MGDVAFALDAAEETRFHERGVPRGRSADHRPRSWSPCDRRTTGSSRRAPWLPTTASNSSGTDLPQVLDAERYAPELGETDAFRNASDLARRLLGPDTVPTGMHAIRKSGRTGAETPWHQDEAYWDPARDHFALSVWIPLQQVTEDNGCMQFQPGSNRLPGSNTAGSTRPRKGSCSSTTPR